MISIGHFRALEAQWQAAFDPPYEAGAEFREYGTRVSLAIFKGGQKVYEHRDQLAECFIDPDSFDLYIERVKAGFPRSRPE